MWVCTVVGWLVELEVDVDADEDVREDPPGLKHSSIL